MRAMPDVSVPFEDFVRARSAALFRFALLLTAHQDRSEAEDLLQEALERAYRHWPRICRSGDPERYVRRVLSNASTDRWRRLRRRPELPLPGDERGPVAGDHASDVADRDFLLQALGSLAPRQRAVLVLRYFCDLSEAETADVLRCGVGTVKSQASRGLARLREVGEAAPAAAQTVPGKRWAAGERERAERGGWQ
jgi:RNA polymerase sigma-70 factor (sigma-E family)